MKKTKMIPLLGFAVIIIANLLCSCSHSYINARTYPYTRKDLASYQLDTPDPLKTTLLPTEMVVVDWKLPLHLSSSEYEEYSIRATLRFHDETQRIVAIPISTAIGTATIMLTQEEYVQRGGMSSYNIILMHQKTQIAQSRHKLWEEKIVLVE